MADPPLDTLHITPARLDLLKSVLPAEALPSLDSHVTVTAPGTAPLPFVPSELPPIVPVPTEIPGGGTAPAGPDPAKDISALDLINLANEIADVNDDDDDVALVKALLENAKASEEGGATALSARDLALGFDENKIIESLRAAPPAPDGPPGPTAEIPTFEPLPRPLSGVLMAEHDAVNGPEVQLEDAVKEPHVDEPIAAAMVAVATPNLVPVPMPVAVGASEAPVDDIGSRLARFKKQLFKKETAAFLAGMSLRNELPLASTSSVQSETEKQALNNAVASVLKSDPKLDLQHGSVLSILEDDEKFKAAAGLGDGDEDGKIGPAVAAQLKAIQTVQALAPSPEVVSALLGANLTTAFQIAQTPENVLATKLQNVQSEVDSASLAKEIHSRAMSTVARNDEALTAIVQLARGTGIAAVDGVSQPEEMKAAAINFREELKSKLPNHANLAQLFGSLDYCDCSDCNSVLSPAAYFVELMQYLGSNNLEPFEEEARRREAAAAAGVGLKRNPLEVLLSRRPDLKHLELSCANANTDLPYIDLANEVMESYVVYLQDLEKNTVGGDAIKPFNVLAHWATSMDDGRGEGSSSQELLTKPQNTQYESYRALKTAMFPMTDLPFNQPVFAIRKFLELLKTSAAEVNEVFKEKYVPPRWTKQKSTAGGMDSELLHNASGGEGLSVIEELPIAIQHPDGKEGSGSNSEYATEDSEAEYDLAIPPPPPQQPQFCPTPISEEDREELIQLREQSLRNTADAEALGLTLEEYIILTKQAFWPARHFMILYGEKGKLSDYENEYRREIGVRELFRYWGFENYQEMEGENGLMCVKDQFLPRVGISYAELVELLQTEFINPSLPTGRDKIILDTIRTTYRELFMLLQETSRSLRTRFSKIIERLEAQGWFEQVSSATKQFYTHQNLCAPHCDPHEYRCRFYGCKHKKKEKCECEKRWFRHWIYKNFEEFADLVVLKSGEMEEDCDIEDVRLMNLNGIPLGAGVYDRMHVFLRLWRKLEGWSMAELDYALRGFGIPKPKTSEGVCSVPPFVGDEPATPSMGTKNVLKSYQDVDDVDWEDFADVPGCQDGTCGKQGCARCAEKRVSVYSQGTAHTTGSGGKGARLGLPSGRESRLSARPVGGQYDAVSLYSRASSPGFGRQRERESHHGSAGGKQKLLPGGRRLPIHTPAEITPEFLHEVAALKELVDKTGMTLLPLLALWSDIDTRGENSEYKRLFLTHNLMALDPIFKPDEDGNYLSTFPPAKISDHERVLVTALKIKAEELATIYKVSGIKEDELSLENLSMIYRYTLLAKILGVPISELESILETLPSPFAGPTSLLTLLDISGKISEQNFTFKQLAFIIHGIEPDPKKPFTPTLPSVLKFAKTLYDGLTEIETRHILPQNEEEATSEAILNKLALVRDDATTLGPKVVAFLEGKVGWETNAPRRLAVSLSAEGVGKKVVYRDGPEPKLIVTGLLTEEEAEEVGALTKNEGWTKALGRIEKQAAQYFSLYLADIFTDKEAAMKILMQGDVEGKSAGEKKLFYLRALVPFVRNVLARRVAVDTVASTTGLAGDVVEVLFENVVTNRLRNRTGLDVLMNIHNAPEAKDSHWDGHLIVAETAAYSFGITSTSDTDDGNPEQPSDLILENELYEFSNQQEDPSNLFLTNPIYLQGGRIYKIRLLNQKEGSALKWKTDRKVLEQIPATALLAEYSRMECTEILNELNRISMVIQGFEFGVKEVEFFADERNSWHFGRLDFGRLTWGSWLKLADYSTLKKSLQKTAGSSTLVPLIELFSWAGSRLAQTSALLDKLVASTGWSKSLLRQLLSPEHLDLFHPRNFRDERALIRIQKAIEIYEKTGVEVSALFRWARPRVGFGESHAVALDIDRCVRALYTQTDWEAAAKGTYDALRTAQNNALVKYLTAHPKLKERNVVDADSLYEFFLIDVQMCPCMKTTRILQATASIQQFVQRCFLGLEPEVPPVALDRKRWENIGKYRLSEVNKKVFLWPENVLKASLRDTKSPLFTEFESEILQKELTPENIVLAVKNYVTKLAGLANLEIQAVYEQNETYTEPFSGGESTTQHRVHVFARTKSIPFRYYHRYYDVAERNWYPWTLAEMDIPTYEPTSPEMKNIRKRPSGFLVPFSYDNRLILTFPVLMSKTGQAPLKFTDPMGNIKKEVSAEVDKSRAEVSVANKAKDEKWIKDSWTEVDKVFAENTPKDSEITTVADRDKIKQKWNTTNTQVKAKVEGLIIAADTNRSNIPDPNAANKNPESFRALAESGVGDNAPNQYWEIKLAWTEWKDGKWTPRTLSGESVIFQPAKSDVIEVERFQFLPQRDGNSGPVKILIYHPKVEKGLGMFKFDGVEMVLGWDALPNWPENVPGFYFQQLYLHRGAVGRSQAVLPWGLKPAMNIFSYWQSQNQAFYNVEFGTVSDQAKFGEVYYGPKTQLVSVSQDETSSVLSRGPGMLHPLHNEFAVPLLGAVSNTKDISRLQKYFKGLGKNMWRQAFGQVEEIDAQLFGELNMPYSLYNWEIGFHIPMLLVETLMASQSYELALKVANLVFDPTTLDIETDIQNRWQFVPFAQTNRNSTVDSLLRALNPGQRESMESVINEWRNKPLLPHAIARARPIVYMKWAATKYIDILVGLGDYYYKKNSKEYIAQALQCYVLAAHLYGSKGQKLPVRGKKKAETFASLTQKWDSFSNAMVEMELSFPFIVEAPPDSREVSLPSIFGFATSRYFCIPNNPQIATLRDTIGDRLFKIRHCQDIMGNFQQLPNYEPPIDPALAVAAAAAGVSMSSALNDLNAAMPAYRFSFLLAKAMELVNEVKSLGSSFLSAKESSEAEEFGLLQQGHEKVMQDLIMSQKNFALDEAQKALTALEQSAVGVANRFAFYSRQMGRDGYDALADSALNSDQDLKPVEYDFIKKPELNETDGYAASPNELAEIEAGNIATILAWTSSIITKSAEYFEAIPEVSVNAEPFGIGLTLEDTIGPIGAALSIAANATELAGSKKHSEAEDYARIGQLQRDYEGRALSANEALFELRSIRKEIIVQRVRIAMAEHEIEMQQKLIDQQAECFEFLKRKHTNKELYDLQASTLKDLYYQTYQTAYEWAKKSEMAYNFERGTSGTSYINFGYWNAANNGLLAGEQLGLALQKLEIAYTETRGYDYEISRTFSLREINPLALLLLKETGFCEFALPEILFDLDFPGHYRRKLKSVSVSISHPNIAPHTSVNATLSLLKNRFRTTALARSRSDYVEKLDTATGSDDRFRSTHIPISAIAVSSADNDSGLFNLDFSGDQYLPFEGAGAISTWRLELPGLYRQFDYGEMSNVLISLKYTAVEGGAKLKDIATENVKFYVSRITEAASGGEEGGLTAIWDIPSEFPDEWGQMLLSESGDRVLRLPSLPSHLPFMVRQTSPGKILASSVDIYTENAIDAKELVLRNLGGSGSGIGFTAGRTKVGRWNLYSSDKGLAVAMKEWEVRLGGGAGARRNWEGGRMLVIVRYVLK